jgi:hypothetical protein
MEVSMLSRDVRLLLVGVALLAFPLRAAADEQRLTAINPDGQEACFGRVYDAQHLKAHPGQKVERIFLLYGRDPVSRPNEQSGQVQSSELAAYLTTTMRGAKTPQWTSASCSQMTGDDGKTNVICGGGCGRSMGELKRDAKGSLILSDLPKDVYLEPDAEETLGKAEYARQLLGPDDDGFSLTPQPLATCKAEFGRIDPPNPALGPPLRERLKPDQAFCYGRDYDADHLKGHPSQVTTSIRVYRGKAEIASYAAANKPEDWPDNAAVTVKVTTRQQSSISALTYFCQGEADQWRCSPTTAAGGCDIAQKEIFIKRGVDGTMMLANPKSALPIVDLCSPGGKGSTRSDDKVYRMSVMPLSACGL